MSGAISLKIQSKHFIKKLGRAGSILQITAAKTLNESAEQINENYRKRLKTKTKLRNKFSLGSIKTFKANPIGKGNFPRPLHRINAITGVRKMKNGKDHYLHKLERGGTTRGNPRTKNKVPVPLQQARISGLDNKSIAGRNRLTKGKTQTLKIRGKKIGVRGDGYNSTGRRWAVLYGASRQNSITGDTTKPFYMIDNSNKLGIFKMKRKRIIKIRSLSKNTVRRKAEPHFQKSIKQVPPREIQRRFVRNAKKALGK